MTRGDRQGDIPDQQRLFRVFNMRRETPFQIPYGSLKTLCQLEAYPHRPAARAAHRRGLRVATSGQHAVEYADAWTGEDAN
jgi:hypothetical protein